MIDTSISYPHNLNYEEKEYLSFHSQRYRYLIDKIKKLMTHSQEIFQTPEINLKLLDIGPHLLTYFLRQKYACTINTLGYDYPKFNHLRTLENHYEVDLNQIIHLGQYPKPVAEYHIMTMCEVFEHLYLSPHHFLKYLNGFLVKGGFFLIGTPNAVRIKNRLSMFFGNNPFEPIREDWTNPGHFREYTRQEMFEIAREEGFSIFDFEYRTFFPQHPRDIFNKAISQVYNFMIPDSWQNSMVCILQKL